MIKSIYKLLLVLVLLAPLTVSADKMTITRLTDNTVNIGGRILKIGDSFEDGAEIKWLKPTQQMEAKNTRTGTIYRFSARQFAAKKGVSSVKDFFLRVNKASTRKAEGADLVFIQSPTASKFPERRIALVIGNTNYTDISSLRNPMYDAAAVSESLGKLGFDVLEAYDCDYADMVTALNKFAQRANNYDVALFYYSGHGLQEGGHNYLIPITAKLEFKSELNRCLDAYDVLERMESSGVGDRIICLDACRDVKTSWTRSASAGLSTMEGSPGTAVICSTRSGQVALDGETDNSPFTSAFVNALGEKDLGFSEMMSRVVKSTYEATSQRQCPIVNGTLLSDFVFNPIGTTIRTLTSKAASASSSQSAAQERTNTTVHNTRPVAPSVSSPKTPEVQCDVPGLRVSVSNAVRMGKNAYVDVVFINDDEFVKKASFVGIEPCGGFDGYITCAWDSNGEEYMLERGKIAVFKGDSQVYSTMTFPSGVPVKVRLMIYNVPSSVTNFPMLTMAFRELMPYESYGQALMRVRNIGITTK